MVCDKTVKRWAIGTRTSHREKVKRFCIINDLDYDEDSHTGTFYKAVIKTIDDRYCSIFEPRFEYKIGKSKEAECDPDRTMECSQGIHMSNLMYATRYARNNRDRIKARGDIAYLELSADFDNIVVPYFGDKVRASKVLVVREVPLAEVHERNSRYSSITYKP